jgi:hypothetical protein
MTSNGQSSDALHEHRPRADRLEDRAAMRSQASISNDGRFLMLLFVVDLSQ